MCNIEKTLEYIFLPSCGICNKLGEGYLCKKCEKELKKYELNLYGVENINNYIEKLHVFKYEKMIRELIIQYKFNEKSYLYKAFCELIIKNKKVFDFIKSYDIIIPVPIHKTRMRKRGYNQSELIAKELAKKLNIGYNKKVLIKVMKNKPQSILNKKERKENTENVYKIINIEKIYNKRILIFDDIYTTGATINACIKELKKAKVKKIGVLTLAKD